MILVLCPLKLEHDALVQALSSLIGSPRRSVDDVVYFGEQIALGVGGHGKVRFALATQAYVRALAPTLVVGAGACGALIPGLELGSVIVAEHTVEHDFNLSFVSRPLPSFAGDASAIAKLKTQSWPGFQVHFATIASGDEDVVTQERASQILARTQGASVVAWEGAGLARAALFCQTPFLELRAVVDHADANAVTDFKKNVSSAMKNIAEVLRSLVS